MLGIWLAYALNMLGIYMAYAWHMLGICLAYAWHMLGICLEYAWNMLGICLAYDWNVLGICLAYATSTLTDICLAYAAGTLTEGTQDWGLKAGAELFIRCWTCMYFSKFESNPILFPNRVFKNEVSRSIESPRDGKIRNDFVNDRCAWIILLTLN